MHKVYIPFDPMEFYPWGEGLFYECQQCGGVIDTAIQSNDSCECQNLRLDIDQGRFAVREKSLIRLFRYEDDE